MTSTIPPSRFQVSLTGEVQSGTFAEPIPTSVIAYSILSSNPADWTLVTGEGSGISPKAHSSSTEVVWNIPISCSFDSTSPSGWPRITVTVFSSDWYGRDILIGYGSLPVPTQPGMHKRTIELFAPVYSSWWRGFVGWLFGKRPMLTKADEFLVKSHAGRERVVVRATGGSVNVNVTVAIKGSDNFNLRF